MFDLTPAWPLGLSRRTWWLFALGFVAVLALALLEDHQISQWAQSLPSEVVGFFAQITQYGLSGWILIPAAVLFVVSAPLVWLVRQKVMKLMLVQMCWLYAFIFIGVGLPSLFTTLVKRLIGRGRPSHYDTSGLLSFAPNWGDWTSQSFPSGHTTTAFALAFVVSFLAERWTPFALLFGVAIAASRVVLGVHYPSDVIAGAVVGTLGAYAVRAFFAQRGWGFRRGRDGHIRPRDLSSLKRYISLQRRRQAAR